MFKVGDKVENKVSLKNGRHKFILEVGSTFIITFIHLDIDKKEVFLSFQGVKGLYSEGIFKKVEES